MLHFSVETMELSNAVVVLIPSQLIVELTHTSGVKILELLTHKPDLLDLVMLMIFLVIFDGTRVPFGKCNN